MFRQGADEALCETWKKLKNDAKKMLRSWV